MTPALQPGDPRLDAGAPVMTRAPNRLSIAALVVVVVAVFVRVFTLTSDKGLLPWYFILQALFILLFALGWSRRLTPRLRGLVFALQSALALGMLMLEPERDFVTALFVVLSYQSTLVFSGRLRWGWVALFLFLTGISLMATLGPLRGLALALVPMAACIVLSAYAVAREQIVASQSESEGVIAELEATYRRLETYAAEVDELAGLEERNRLARELHDSVSQTMFSVLLTASTARMLLNKDPGAVIPQLERLQELTQGALRHMRGLIADLDTGTVPE
jgi:signal transduction histidine kinase